jgi:hypothetical protein
MSGRRVVRTDANCDDLWSHSCVSCAGQHGVKEPTEPNGTPRYSCDGPHHAPSGKMLVRGDVDIEAADLFDLQLSLQRSDEMQARVIVDLEVCQQLG